MRILQVAHGYPPAQSGGTERSLRALARGLARRGHEVSVLAASPTRSQDGSVSVHEEPRSADPLDPQVLRLARDDLHFDHWHKGLSPNVGRAFSALVKEREIDVVHVHHWLRLTRDLVQRAALAGRPSVVSLHDHFSTCPLAFRIDPRTGLACDVPSGPGACVPCAATLPPFTPWIPREEGWMALGRRRQGFLNELHWARAISAPTAAHAAAVERHLELEPGALGIEVLPVLREALEPRPPTELPAPGADEPLTLVAWGALARAKGPDLVLDALARLPAGSVRLAFLGAPDEAAFGRALEARAEGLEVEFHGPYESAELARHPALAAHAFVSGTRAPESYGLVVDEALELGLPLVVPATGAFAERLGEGAHGPAAALLYEQASAEDLARALERLRVEPGLWQRLRREARELGDRVRVSAGDVSGFEGLYERARDAGPPEVPRLDVGDVRMAEVFLEVWDQALGLRTPEQLGLVGEGDPEVPA